MEAETSDLQDQTSMLQSTIEMMKMEKENVANRLAQGTYGFCLLFYSLSFILPPRKNSNHPSSQTNVVSSLTEQQQLNESNAQLLEINKEMANVKQKAEEERDVTKTRLLQLEAQLATETNERQEFERKHKESNDKVKKIFL